jgi:methylamine dehydrogenase accessory protein MauD
MHGWWLISYLVLWGLVLSLTVLVVALARQIGALHLRLGPRGALELDDEGPPLGVATKQTEVAGTAGEALSVGGVGEAQFLLFVSPACPVCEQVLPSVPAIAAEGDLSPYVVVDSESELRADGLPDRRRLRAPVVRSADLARAYQIPGTPYAVVLDESGVVRAKGTVNNLEQVEGLARTARRRASEARAEAATA